MPYFLCGRVHAALRSKPSQHCSSLHKLNLKRDRIALYHGHVEARQDRKGASIRSIQAADSGGNPPQYGPTPKIPESNGHDWSSTTDTTGGKESKMVQLRRYGVAGMLSYGLLNTVYYLGMFLFAWFYISPVPGGLGFRKAVERFIKLFALIWAGSQVTKIPRAACALAVAPAIDRALTWIIEHSRFNSRGEVFGVVVVSCFGIALIVFLVITLLWA